MTAREKREVLKLTAKQDRAAVKKLLEQADKLAKKLAKFDIVLSVF